MHNSGQLIYLCLKLVKKGILNIFFIGQHVCILNIIKWILIILLSAESAYPENPDSEYGWEKLIMRD